MRDYPPAEATPQHLSPHHNLSHASGPDPYNLPHVPTQGHFLYINGRETGGRCDAYTTTLVTHTGFSTSHTTTLVTHPRHPHIGKEGALTCSFQKDTIWTT